MTRARFAIWSNERGNSVIELALVAPVFATLVVGAVDISLAVSTKLQLEQAAQRTIEMVQRTNYLTSQNTTLQSEAQTAAGTGSSATVSDWLECNNNGTHLDYDTGTCTNATDPYARYVQVSVQKSFTPIFGTRFFPHANADGTVTVSATAGVRTQ